MKPGIIRLSAPTRSRTRDRIARWICFAALVALLAMATLPITPSSRDIAAENVTHWSETWHG
jgi:hypothetical protein